MIILIGAYFLCKDQETYNASVYGFSLIAVGYGIMLISAICPTSFLYKFNSKFTTFIAMLSYSIYLTHKGIIHITHKLLDGHKMDASVLFFICMFTCLLFALLLNAIIEKPFMKLRYRIIKTGK
ncbi:MAG: hypothetical protein PW786_01865 [Arachidicoccus sp.]|nr:hypothetical protein [Arachidicoccus sp.]